MSNETGETLGLKCPARGKRSQLKATCLHERQRPVKVAASTLAAVSRFIPGEKLASSIFCRGGKKKRLFVLDQCRPSFSLPAPPEAWTRAQMHYGIERDTGNLLTSAANESLMGQSFVVVSRFGKSLMKPITSFIR